MKTMEIKALGLEELSANEIMVTDGGSTAAYVPAPIVDAIVRFLGFVSGVLIGYGAASKCTREREEEVEVYYGGELDAAVCIG